MRTRIPKGSTSGANDSVRALTAALEDRMLTSGSGFIATLEVTFTITRRAALAHLPGDAPDQQLALCKKLFAVIPLWLTSAGPSLDWCAVNRARAFALADGVLAQAQVITDAIVTPSGLVKRMQTEKRPDLSIHASGLAPGNFSRVVNFWLIRARFSRDRRTKNLP
jgi:hypothetical protein